MRLVCARFTFVCADDILASKFKRQIEMLILVSGKNSSGKSAYAEKIAVRFGGTRYYIATMIPHGSGGLERIVKHRRQREGMGFITLEQTQNISSLQLEDGCAVLLEDVSNLLANAMFASDNSSDAVLADIRALCARCCPVVAVTISGLCADDYSGETRAYVTQLNRLNTELYAIADTVVQLDGGNPVLLKGAVLPV